MAKNKHKRNKAFAPKKPAYTPMTKEEKKRDIAIGAAVILVVVGLILWNRFAPWNGMLPKKGDNLRREYPDNIVVNMDDSSYMSRRKYYITGTVNSTVEGYSIDTETTIKSDKNENDFFVKPDEGTDSPYAYYYISGNRKPMTEVAESAYGTMSAMYEGYCSELTDGEFGGKTCKYFTYKYDRSHDEPVEGEEAAETAEAAEEREMAESAVFYFPAYKDSCIIIQTPVAVNEDPANFIDEQEMLDFAEKIMATVEFR